MPAFSTVRLQGRSLQSSYFSFDETSAAYIQVRGIYSNAFAMPATVFIAIGRKSFSKYCANSSSPDVDHGGQLGTAHWRRSRPSTAEAAACRRAMHLAGAPERTQRLSIHLSGKFLDLKIPELSPR